ncbi:DUF3040 domain-containing protein [Lentzea cavernae]|uniref:DUF3040 domain-containing protein n=1 Tax=Lentzea cavernae TaxID=2020703 RepID=A0ABQ3MEJ2_9PSEU|nr:DUF3040 domain-containing protein [Lentzea cavernae]GHH38599.1 hypothetical protein GCM10017774_28770 [Lentzea cavernae]
MLSDRERETLCEIERGLSDDDPKLAQTLKSVDWPVKRGRHGYACTALMVVAGLLTVVALGLGHMTGALACALVAGWAWGTAQRRKTPEVQRSQVTD